VPLHELYPFIRIWVLDVPTGEEVYSIAVSCCKKKGFTIGGEYTPLT